MLGRLSTAVLGAGSQGGRRWVGGLRAEVDWAPASPTKPEAACFLCSINFNQDASLICVSSDHGTVHIFAAEDPKRNKQSR